MSSKFVVTVYERRTTNYRLKCEGRGVWSIKAEWWRNMAWANLFTVRQQNYRRTHSSSREQIQIFIETAKLDAITCQYEWCFSSRFCFDIKSVFNLHVIVTIIIMGVFRNKVTSQLAGIIRRNRTQYNTINILRYWWCQGERTDVTTGIWKLLRDCIACNLTKLMFQSSWFNVYVEN
jgi:hypothetical protein